MKPWEGRHRSCVNAVSRRLLALMHQKKTNLALSADVTTQSELLCLAASIGPEICVLKTHIDMIVDYDPKLITQLQILAKRHQFMILEDRKFADIGHTTQQQYQGGIYRISDWATMVTTHAIPGPGIIEGLKSVGLPKGNGCLMICQMSSKDNLAQGVYRQSAIDMARKHPDFVMGFITQERITDCPEFLHFTPGIRMPTESGLQSDHLGQCYITPERAIRDLGTDVMIIGRGIYASDDPLSSARHYRALGAELYFSG